jgi:hypothetical protein
MRNRAIQEISRLSLRIAGWITGEGAVGLQHQTSGKNHQRTAEGLSVIECGHGSSPRVSMDKG